MTAPSRQDHHLPGLGYARLTPLYDTVIRLLGVPRLHGRLLEQAGVRPFCAVLEIGCGTGDLALQVKRTQPSAHVTGIDPDTMALTAAQKKAARAGLDLTWDCGVAQRMPYSDGAFDRVLSSLMLHHLDAEQRRAALAEARRVLAPDGSLHVVDLGGMIDHRDGFMARRLAHTARLADNYDNGLLSVVSEAGFTRVAEVEQRVSRVLGRIVYYRAER